MMKKLVLFILVSITLVGCTTTVNHSFKKELESMYKISIHQVLGFMELEEENIEDDKKVERLVKSCEEYIKTVEEFQNIDVPEEGENLYEKVNLLAMDISNTLVMLSHSIDENDTEMYQSQKDNLAFLFVESGYIGEELGEYLEKEDFIENIMGDYI